MNLEQRVRLGYSYLQYLQERVPEYFVTLTYREPYGDQLAESAMKGFTLKLLNRIPHRTRRNIGGLVCAERHTKYRFEGAYHFHFLLWGLDSSMPDAHSWLRLNVTRAASELYPRVASPLCDCGEVDKPKRKRTCLGGMSCRGKQMSGPEFVNVQRIEYTPEQVHEYVVEDVYRLDRPTGGQLLDIGPSGVTGSLLSKNLL